MCIASSSTEIQDLITQSQQERFRDTNRLIVLSEVLLQKSKEQNDICGQIHALNNLGLAYTWMYQVEKMFDCANRALALIGDNHLPIHKGFALINLIASYRQIGQMDKAIEANFELRQIANTHDNDDLRCFALVNDAILEYLITQKNFEVGRDIFLQVAEYAKRDDVAYPEVLSYINLGVLYFYRNDFQQSRHYGELAYEAATRTGFIYGQILAINNLSSVYARLGEFDLAHETAKKGYDMAVRHNTMIHHAVGHIGLVHFNQKAYSAAIEHLIESENLSKENNNIEWLVGMQERIMQTYEALGDYKNAFLYSKKFHETKQKISDHRALLNMKILEREYEEHERINRLELEIERKLQHELDRTKQRILNRIAHEFRTPLATIQTSTEILVRYHERLTTEKRSVHGSRITEQIDKILLLLDDVLSVLRETHTRQEITLEQEGLHTLMVNAIALAEQNSNAQDRVHLLVEPTVQAIRTDATLLGQTMYHLLTNALKFSKDDVALKVTKTSDDHIIISVSDRGIGIPLNEQAMVFETLVRGSNIDEVSGNGLGLTIVKNYVDVLGGTIAIDSVPAKYTTVVINLPNKIG